MIYKKNIQKLLNHCIKFIINENRFKHYDLLNNFNNFNMKMLKFNELKLYINNILISKFTCHSYIIYKKIIDTDYKIITKINSLNLDIIDIEFYTSIYNEGYFNDKNCVKLYIYSKKYLNVSNKTDNNKSDNKINIISYNEILPEKETSYLINNQSSTVLNENEFNIIEWLNN